MRNGLMKQIPEKAKNVWRLYGTLEVVVGLMIMCGLLFLTIKFDWPMYIFIIAAVLVVIYAILVLFLFPAIRWQIWRYEVREQEIEIQSGLFIIKRTIIPMVRVQHVDTVQGPILKKYQLANISISTAATTHIIPMLHTATADELRKRISELARVAEQDV